MTVSALTFRLLVALLVAVALVLPASSFAGTESEADTQTVTTTTTAEAPATSTTTTSAPGEAEAPAGGASTEAEAPPLVTGERDQGASRGGGAHTHGAQSTSGSSSAQAGGEEAGKETGSAGVRAAHKAPAPSALTPSLPLDLRSSITGVPSFFIESFQIPPFLLPIFQAAGTAYGIPWQVLAAINEVETDYGRDLSVSSAGAEGWMQFLPSEWAQYGVDANGDGYKDPYNPADAIFAAARYLRAAGGDTDIDAAVYSYNHSQEYVESVMLRAQLLGGTPSELLGAITGLTEGRFPVHAASRFSDGFQTLPASGSEPARTLVGTTIYSQAGAPVIAVADGEVVQIGESPSLGRYVSLRDAYGNTYTYAQLGDVASVYPVLEPHVSSTVSPRISKSSNTTEPAPSGPATAGAQARSPISEAGTVSGLAFGAAAQLESAPAASASASAATKPTVAPAPKSKLRKFAAGPDEVYLHTLRPGVQVIAGTVLGHVGAETGAQSVGVEAAPHMFFQIRPAGAGAPLIDPKPILDGWVDLENTSVFRAKGENPFLATSPTVGQVLLESKQQLEPQVLRDGGIHLGTCARQDVQEGRVDKRVLAMLEYLSVQGLRPTVSGLPCAPKTAAAVAANVPDSASSESVNITAINGTLVAGHQGPGSVADTTVRKLLMLQGLARPKRIVSLMSYPGASGAFTSTNAATAIHVTFGAPASAASSASSTSASSLTPSGWVKLIARLGEIPDPIVGAGHSSASIPDTEAGTGGND